MRYHPAVLCAALLAGCATSPQFQRATAYVVPHVAADAIAYVTADAALDAATRAERLSQAAALGQSAAAADSVTDQGVYIAWSAVSPWYRKYVVADATLPALLRTAKVGRADQLDALIAAESKRPFGASTRPS